MKSRAESESAARDLPRQLANELAALRLDSFETARDTINGRGGVRSRYLAALATCDLTEPARNRVGSSIQNQCDGAVDRLRPLLCAEKQIRGGY